MAGALTVVALQVGGFFGPMDTRILGAVAELRPVDRGAAPLLVALDERMNDRWGPPPWSADQWTELSVALAEVGVHKATLVDPPERVVRAEAFDVADDHTPWGAPGAELRVPTVMVNRADGSWLPTSLQGAVGPLVPRDAHLALPTHPDGVVRDLRSHAGLADGHGVSAFCAWTGRCPSPGALAVPLTTGSLYTLPTVSASALLNGHVRIPGDAGRQVLVGLTGPAWSRAVAAGPRGGVHPYPVVVGAAITASASPVATVWSWHRLMGLLGLLAVAAGAGHRALDGRGRTAYALLAPLGVVFSCVGVYFTGWLVPPVTALALVVLWPAVVQHLAEHSRFMGFLGEVREVLDVDQLRHVPSANPLRSEEALLTKLGSLARTYLDTDVCALLMAERGAVRFAGGFGISADEMVLPRSLRDGHWQRVVRRPQVGDSVPELMRAGDREARVVPLFEGETLLGFWVLPYDVESGPPATNVIAELVAWLRPRLQLLGAPSERRWLPDGLQDQLHAAMQSVADTVGERRHQLDVLRHLAWPLLVADVSGEVVQTNLAVQRLLRDTELASVGSVRELLWRISGELEAAASCARLFTGREQLALSWHDRSGRVFEVGVRPVESMSSDLQGFVAVFRDVTAQERIKQVRTHALQRAETQMTRHLDALTTLTDGLDPSVTRSLEHRVEELRTATETLQSVAGFETELRQALPSNVVGLMQLALEDLEPLRLQQHVRVEMAAPGRTRPAQLVPTAALQALTELLTSALSSSPRGGRLRVHIADADAGTEIEVEWPGAGLDARVIAMVNRGDQGLAGHLPAHLGVFARLRDVFEGLQVRSTDGLGAAVSFRAPRVS